MIPDDQVQEVRERADIVEIVGEVVRLKKAGREYKANCPFHEEKTPSFWVNPDKGVYHCFGCGAAGDAIEFVRRRLDLDFVDAVKHVAGRSGVQIREVRSRDELEEDPLRPFHEANAFAQKWFRDNLEDPVVGRSGREYLAGRGIDGDTAERFGLGYAPDAWREFKEAAAVHALDETILLKLGLLATSERRPGETYDGFRNRITFPIWSLRGEIMGFGGRLLGESGPGRPKYKNSSESPVYHKGGTLYNLRGARRAIRATEEVIVVEGYMDVVSLGAGGFDNVVAPLGTAFTEAQADLVQRLARRAFLLFDSDRSGLEATFKAADVLLAAGVQPLVVTLPDGEDPDTLLRKQGPDRLREFLDGAVDVLDRKIQILEERDWFSTLDRKRDAVDRLIPTLRAAQDPATRDMYVARVAEKTGVTRRTLEEEMARLDSPRAAPVRTERPAPRTAAPPRRTFGAEYALLRVLARDRSRRTRLLEMALERVGPQDFKDASDRAIFQAFVDDPELDVPPPGMDPVAAERLARLLEEPPDDASLAHGEREFTAAVARLEDDRLAREMDELQRRIEASEDGAEKLELIKEKERLRQERRAQGVVGGGDYARRLARGFPGLD
ncbi:MAG: DNA primase [Gemmatimonadota bacterium]